MALEVGSRMMGEEEMPRRFNYSGANFGKRDQNSTPGQQYVREKAALVAAEKYFSPEEFEKVMADLSYGLITVRIYDEGILINRDGQCGRQPR